MKKRKLFALIAVATALSITAVGCGSGSTSDDSKDTQSSVSLATDESSAEEPEESKNEGSTEEPEESKDNEVVDFEPITVVDNDECAIIITELDEDNFWGYSLKVELENKSAEKTYMFSVEDGAINSVSADPFFASEVAAGKKSNNTISFSDSQLNEYGVNEVTDIELSFRVYDTDDWEADDVANETVHVYPIGEENATVFVRENLDTDVVLADNDEVKVVVIGTEDDSIWGYTVNFYLENKTDHSMMFAIDNASVNGYMADPFWANSLSANKVGFSGVSWDDTTLEEAGISDISEISEIEFTVRAYNDDDYSESDSLNETFTLNVD